MDPQVVKEMASLAREKCLFDLVDRTGFEPVASRTLVRKGSKARIAKRALFQAELPAHSALDNMRGLKKVIGAQSAFSRSFSIASRYFGQSLFLPIVNFCLLDHLSPFLFHM